MRLVVAADKLHNVRDLLSSYRVHGDDLWSHFKGGRDGTLWYYRAVVDALTDAAKPEEHQLQAIIEEIDRTLAGLQQAMAEQDLAAAARGPLLTSREPERPARRLLRTRPPTWPGRERRQPCVGSRSCP